MIQIKIGLLHPVEITARGVEHRARIDLPEQDREFISER
jgi:hypothetical protein